MGSNAVRNSQEASEPAAEEKSGGGGRWDRVRSVVLRRGWNLGKKVAIVGAVVSSAPVVIPPLLFFSTLGFAVAFPFGVYHASFAGTDLLMRSLLGPPNEEEEEEEEEEFFEAEEEMESEGDMEEEEGEEIVWQLGIEEKGNGGMVEEEERQREEAGMGERKEVVGDKKEEECGGGMFPYGEDMRKGFDVNLVPLVLVYPDGKYPSEVYDGWNRGDIVTEEQLMKEMKMREEMRVENEKDQGSTAQGLPPRPSSEKEIVLSSQHPSAAEDGGEEEMGGGEQMEAEAEVKEEVGFGAAALKSEESLRGADEELEEREVEVVPSSEYASDVKGGGDRGDVGLVGEGEMLDEERVTEGVGSREEREEEDKKKEEESVGTAACNTEGLLSSSSTITVMPEEYKSETDPISGFASNVKETENSGGIGLLEEDKPMEEMKMGEELGKQWKGKKGDSVSSNLEHENKIKQSTLSLGYALTFEKGYEGAVGIREEEELIGEAGLGEAYAGEEKGYERDVGIEEEEKQTEVGLIESHAVEEKGYQGNMGIGEENLTEEVAFGDAFEVEKAYERDVGILEEERHTEVELGEACTVEKGYERDVGIMDREKSIDEVGLGEAHVLEVKGYGGDVGIVEEEKLIEEGLGEAIVVEEKKYEGSVGMMDGEKPTEEVGLGEACAVEEKGYGGDVGIMEEEKPTEKVGLTEATAVEDKRYEGSVGIMDGEKPTDEVGLGEEYAVEEKRHRGDVGIIEEGKPIEKVGLGEVIAVEEKRYEGDVGIIKEQKSTAEVGFGEAYAVEKKGHEGDVGTMDEGEPIEGLGQVCTVEEKRHEGDVSIMEELKPTQEVGLGEATAIEVKGYEGDVGIMEEQKPTAKVRLGEACAVEEKGCEGDVGIMDKGKSIEVGLGEACAVEEKRYGGVVGIVEEEKPTEEVGLREACAVEEKRYGGVVGIVEEEKPTEEVGLREACAVEEKWYEGAVGVMEEEKPAKEVGLGEASVVKEKGNVGDVGKVKDKTLIEEVGLQEKREEKGKEHEGVDTTDFESENLLPSAYPSVAVVPEASKIGIEQSSEFPTDVKGGGNRGDTGLMEEEKPVEQIEMREENIIEEKSKKEDDVDASVQKLSQNVYPSNDVMLEEHENSVKQSSLSLEYAYLLKGNECGEHVEMVEEEELTEDAGLGKEIEEVQKGEEAVDTAALESEKLLSGGHASVTALLELHGVETEPSSELACDVKNSGNIGAMGLVGEEKPLEEMVKREEKGAEENEYSVGAAAQGFSQSVCPSVGVVLEKHVDQVKQSNSSSESASVVEEKGHEGGVEMIEGKKPTEGVDVGEEIEKEEGKEYESVYTAAMETEKASFVKDGGEGIGIKLVEEVQPTKETLMEVRQEAENKVMKQAGMGPENKEQLQSTEHFFVHVVSAVQKIETDQSGMSLCYSSVVKQNESGGHIEVLEENILQSDEAGMKEERDVLVEGKEGEGDSAVDPKNDEALSNVDGVVAMEISGESEPSSLNSVYVSAVEYQSLDMAETESRSSIEHGLDLRPGLKVVAVDIEMPVSSDDEGLYSEDKLWEQIFAIRTIMGYKAALHLSPVEELKALFLFTGVKPPASMKDDSDLVELNEKLQFLKSVIGVQ